MTFVTIMRQSQFLPYAKCSKPSVGGKEAGLRTVCAVCSCLHKSSAQERLDIYVGRKDFREVRWVLSKSQGS